MNISSSVENNPAIILLQSTIQAVATPSLASSQVRDIVDISEAAKQLAKAVASAQS